MIALLFAAMLPCAQASHGQAAPKVVNGTPTTGHDAVIALGMRDGNLIYGPFCSATLVDAYWAVTAAHCIEAMTLDYGKFTPVVVADDDWSDGVVDTIATVTDSIMHPDYDSTLYTDDIGLLELASPGLASAEVMGVRDSTVNDTWIDVELRFVGFGITGDDAEDYGTRRYADMPVYMYDEEIIYAWDKEDMQNICSGDSGGPALWLRSDGLFELVGVNAFVAGNTDRPCEEGLAGATRLDTHRDWIEDYVDVKTADELLDDEGGSSPWSGTGGGPCALAPGALPGAGGLVLAVLGLAARRREE